MKRDIIWHCEAAECDTHQSSAAPPDIPPFGWIVVTERTYVERSYAVCGWDCVLKLAATVPPVEII